MREQRCTHCGQIIPPVRYGVRLGPLAARIVDAVQRAGADGIAYADLFEMIYHDRPASQRGALKGYVRQINYKLSEHGAPVCIRRSRAGTYKITAAKQRGAA